MFKPHQVYGIQLSVPHFGYPLWEPDPAQRYDQVSIGDIGYLNEGSFIRMFNVLLPWDHPSNQTFCQPEPYIPLELGPSGIRESRFNRGNYYSSGVTPVVLTNSRLILHENE
jgi:hypothetical protein